MFRPPSTRRFLLSHGLTALALVLATALIFRLSAGLLVPALAVAALFGIFLLHQWLMHHRIGKLVAALGADPALPAPAPGQTLEDWVRQYVAAASRTLAAERELFDGLFDILQDGVLFVDGENRIRRANAAAAGLLAREAGGLAGLSLEDAACPDALIHLADVIRAAGAHQSAEIFLPSIPGPAQVAGIPLRADKESGAAPLMLVLRDLTSVRRLESAGEEYATNVSHELKTPLTLILGYTETLLAQSSVEPAFLERSLRTIERHTKRIVRIIDDLMRLAWLRNEAGASGIPRSLVSVSAIVDEAAGTCREWARAAGIDIEPHVPADLVWHLNSGLLEEALINLVKNAILYALVGPIEINVRVLANGRLEIAVADRGPGLKPEDAARIFDRFYRADKSRSRASGGSGLGLPIVQQIVEAHQGTARVDTAPGEGCTFILEIPPAAAPPPAA